MRNSIINLMQVMAAALGLLLVLTGCQSPAPEMTGATLRLPAANGNLSDAETDHGLLIQVEPESTELIQGQPLAIDCLIINVGPSAIKLPSSPRVLITCIYPDGTRFFGVPENHGEVELLSSRQLKPGERVHQTLILDTQKLNQIGLLELRTLFTFAQMNQGRDRNAWLGRALSNGYGIELVENSLIDSAPALSAISP